MLRKSILRINKADNFTAFERLTAQALVVGGKTGPGNEGFNAALFAAITGDFLPITQLIFVHPRQRIMPPLPCGTVTARVCPTIQRHACATSGADNHRKHGLRPRRCPIHRFRNRQTVGIICQPHFAIQTRTQVFVKRLPVKPGRVGILYHPGVGRD
ncbi:hypothetical protein SDC9_162042 [bioreactor metagenome]|uniref:Uncharacterized protein n=1 Tax=bioreactor metagenome TaxID=1076179 RepID=A0A645FJZ5_9ZZZZ